MTEQRLADEDIQQIARLVKDSLTAENPGFVRTDVCNERTKRIEQAVGDGIKALRERQAWLYALLAGVLITSCGSLLTALLK